MAKFSIALIDDEPSITKLISLGLKDNFDCDIEIFNDSQEAYGRLQKKTFDVIVLDHRMVKLTGMQIVKLLRTTSNPNSKTRILLLTGHIEEAENFDSELLNEVVFLQKPVPESRIVRWVSFMLKNRGPSAEKSPA